MNTPFKMTAADRALAEGDRRDVEIREKLKFSVMHQMSNELDPSSKVYVKGAQPGDIVLTTADAGPKIFRNPEGACVFAVGFQHLWNEYALDVGVQRGSLLDQHEKKPADCVWLKPPRVQKQGNYRVNSGGDIYAAVVETLFAFLMVEADGAVYPGVYALYKTALAYGTEFAARAQSLKVRLPSESGGTEQLSSPTLGKWRVTTASEKFGDRPVFVPRFKLLGRLGEQTGPTLDEWRLIMGLRKSFLAGGSWAPEPPAPLEGPRSGSVAIASDRGATSRDHWEDEGLEPPPPPDAASGDGPGERDPNDPIPF
jgi:hypothetical protein